MAERAATILVFAKAATPGAVKTRLAARLGPELAARLHAAFVSDVVARARDVAQVVVYHAPDEPGAALRALGVPLRPQRGRDLGERMAQAIAAELGRGAERLVLLGADSPDLPRQRLEQALAALDRERLVLGPALDGGYYLIGCRGAPPPAVFRDIPWGTDQVLSCTSARLDECGVRPALLEPWYDVDRPEDLDFLRTHLALLRASSGEERCPETSRLLASGP